MIGDTAGQSGLLCRYLRKEHEVVVLSRMIFDRYMTGDYYRTNRVDCSARYFLKVCVDYIRGFMPDIVHISSMPKFVVLLKPFLIGKKVVNHYHGSDVRDYAPIWLKYLAESVANVTLISTLDLSAYCAIPEKVMHLPQPIDVDLFKPVRVENNGKWLAMFQSDKWLSIKPDSLRDKEIVSFDRKAKKIMYADMPVFLSGFEGYIDVKVVDGFRLQAMSQTGLQCLSLGLSVYDYDDQIRRGFPAYHGASFVADKLAAVYEGLMRK